MDHEISYWIPTQGRLHRGSPAMEMMAMAGLHHETFVVCPAEEINGGWRFLYPMLNFIPQPKELKNIGEVRAWMFKQCKTRYFFMIDDDVSFSHQYEGNPRRTAKADTDLVRLQFQLYNKLLYKFETYPVVGIGSRLFCNHRDFEVENRQTGWAWGYDREVTGPYLKPIMGRLKVLEDVDWCLVLLENGLPNIILSYLVAQSRKVASDPSEGGCGVYRNAKLVEEETAKFIAFHPGIVVPRTPREGLGEATQYRQTIYWKKAFNAIKEGRMK